MQIYSKVLYIFVWFGFVNAMAMNTAKILEVPPPPLALNEVHATICCQEEIECL